MVDVPSSQDEDVKLKLVAAEKTVSRMLGRPLWGEQAFICPLGYRGDYGGHIIAPAFRVPFYATRADLARWVNPQGDDNNAFSVEVSDGDGGWQPHAHQILGLDAASCPVVMLGGEDEATALEARVSFTGGLRKDDITEDIQMAILLWTACLYEHRDGEFLDRTRMATERLLDGAMRRHPLGGIALEVVVPAPAP